MRVRIVGDDSSFQAAMRRADLSTKKVGGSFLEMGKHIAGGLAAFAGISVGVGLIEESVKAAENAQVAHQLLAQQMKNVGLSFEANAPAIQAFTDHLSRLSGFTETDMTKAFTTLIRVTKDVGKAHTDLAIAVDLARLKHIDLETATSLVTKAQIGMVGGLRRVGIDVHAVTENMDALRLAHDRAAAAAKAHGETIEKISTQQLHEAKAADKTATSVAALAQLHKASSGAAETYGHTAAGAMDRFKAAVDDLQIKMGSALLPTITKVAEGILKFADNWGKAGTTANDIKKDLDDLNATFKTMANWVDKLAGKFGGWNKILGFTKDLFEQMTGISTLKGIQFWLKTVGLGGGGGKPNDLGSGAAVTAVTAGKGGKAKNQGEAIAATAQTQLGISYQWGGPAILGQHTDCSGLAQAVLAKNGISVGRTTYVQWTQGKATMSPQAGDLVFFEPNNKGQPQHVGIYIGNGNFIHDPHTGDHVRVEALSNMSSYMGARTYVTASGGGKAPPTTDTTTDTTTTFKKTKKKTAAAGFTLPVDIRTAMSTAALSPGTADDLKELAQAQTFIKSKIGSLKGEQRIQALDALKGINDQIQQIEDASATKQHDALTKAHKKQAAALKAHLDKLKAIVTEKKAVFEQAFGDLVARAMAGFDRETAKGLAAIAAKYGAQTKEEKALADFQANRAADDLAKSRATALANASTDEERAALALGYSLDDQEKALKDAADTSRTTANAQQTAAENAYNDLRDLQKTQLQGWLEDQKGKLETGKTQWDTFWGELVTKAGMAGTDTSSAFWTNFAAAGKTAGVDLGGLTSATAAAAAAAVSPFSVASLSAIRAFGSGTAIPHLQHGGLIAQSGLAVVHRGERVIPSGGNGGVRDVHLHIAGSVLTERDIVQLVRDGIKRDARNNGFGGLSG